MEGRKGSKHHSNIVSIEQILENNGPHLPFFLSDSEHKTCEMEFSKPGAYTNSVTFLDGAGGETKVTNPRPDYFAPRK